MAKKATSLLVRALEMSERQSCDVMRRNSNCTIRHLSSCGILASRRGSLGLPPPPASCQMVPIRSFMNLSVPLIARRMEYSESRSIGYSAEQMYNIVAGVDQYQKFVPWCKKSKVTKGRNGNMTAQLEIGFPPIIERYTSEVTVIPNHQVRAVCTDGMLFNHLETLWRFTPGDAGQVESCNLEFFVSFEFKSLLHSQLATVFFDEVVKQMVNAFEKQATKLYGTGVHQQKSSLRRAT
ncbi:coenzyme Q-binding protein COQ10 homolog, mitochondrial [Carassius auratus]|uniref:Coenzyme Q-binding protein COQ10 homolog, mitochondrial n=1 Tax=Carassius auratus TaxID=7957 RepID=A0A6P6JWB6_CARAU|nr:coenzyme Q-binding protein COQ10 homolog, mitochondrial-like [Carassius auratus]XP_052405715.1 coenzyme Q-binding protein COQ10 homolog, mitochondrial [Carassius gibelio]